MDAVRVLKEPTCRKFTSCLAREAEASGRGGPKVLPQYGEPRECGIQPGW